jgi:hypothetical protein
MTLTRIAQSALFRLPTRICAALVCALGMSGYANVITVTNTNDSGAGSLRQALHDANDGDTINFVLPPNRRTITLTSGGLEIARNVIVSGLGADQLAIDGNANQASFVFGIFPSKTVTISGLNIRNGQLGILNYQGTLTVRNCVVSHNSSSGLSNGQGVLMVDNCVVSLNLAGGIYNDHGMVTVSNCVVTANSYGGIDNNGLNGPTPAPGERGNDRRDGTKAYDGCFASACLTIENSLVSDNSGTGVSNTGTVTIINSTLSGNSAGSGSDGGGISSGNFKAPGSSVTVTNSTISGNSTDDAGGGIYIDYGLVTIVNSTVSGNSAKYEGGGISNFAGGAQIANSTISGNSAASGGGVYNLPDPFGTATIETGNTIFDAGASGENIVNNGGTVTSHGYNVCSDDGGGLLNGPGDQINTDPLLGPLQDNGGPTLTHLPLPGSPAIDAGDPSFIPPPLRDQRGVCFHRVFGRRIDVGSVETQPEPRCPSPAPRPTP